MQHFTTPGWGGVGWGSAGCERRAQTCDDDDDDVRRTAGRPESPAMIPTVNNSFVLEFMRSESVTVVTVVAK